MKSYILASLSVLLMASSLHAQGTYFVDPVSGSNAASGTEAAPFQSLTFALTQAAAGDSITLRAGTYSTLTETLPILLKNDVSIEAFTAEEPVFTAGGVGTVFRLNEHITTETVLRGIVISSCTVGVDIPLTSSVDGLVIEQCNFNGFADSGIGTNDGYGVFAQLSSGGLNQELTIRDCDFAGSFAQDAISIRLSNSTILNAGGVLGNRSTGGVDRSLYLLADAASIVASSFSVFDNIFAGYNQAGLYYHAKGGGGNPLAVSTVNCQTKGNSLLGAGALENGIVMRAEHHVVGQGAVVSPWIRYCRMSDNYVNVLCETINGGGHQADVVADFYGNRIENGVRAGIELTTLIPTAGNDNNDPDFGPGHSGRTSGLNTFAGNTTDFRIGAGVTNTISARFNFFPAGTPTRIGGVPDSAGILSETIDGSFANSVQPDEAVEVQLNAAADSAFVDYDGDSVVGQCVVIVDGSQLDQADIAELANGVGLLLQLPALPEGTKTVTVTNPGGQTGSFALRVTSSSSGSPGGAAGNDCFVATAAHGDYGSHEVVALRRFRDQYLKATPAGQRVVAWYYQEGPRGAAFLLKHEWAQKGTRVALVLPVAIADAVTSWNPGQRFAAGVILLGLLFRCMRRWFFAG